MTLYFVKLKMGKEIYLNTNPNKIKEIVDIMSWCMKLAD